MLVDVYRNLTKGCFSVKACEGPHRGKVIAHAQSVWLDDPEFRVSASGRQRVLREQKKYVHAFVRGKLYSLDGVYRFVSKDFLNIPRRYDSHLETDAMNSWGYGFTYNPYKNTSFVVPFMGDYVELRNGMSALLCNDIGTRVLAPVFYSDEVAASSLLSA